MNCLSCDLHISLHATLLEVFQLSWDTHSADRALNIYDLLYNFPSSETQYRGDLHLIHLDSFLSLTKILFWR